MVKSIRTYMQAAENVRLSKAREKDAEAGLNAVKENVRGMCLRYTGLHRIGKLGVVSDESLGSYGLQESGSDDEGGGADAAVDVKGLDESALKADDILRGKLEEEIEKARIVVKEETDRLSTASNNTMQEISDFKDARCVHAYMYV